MSAPTKKAPRVYPGYKTVGMGQAASYIRAMVAERDANTRARYASHALLLLSDADKAIGEIAGIVEANEQYHGLLRLVEEAGITLLSTNPDEPLSLPEEATNG
jgi:hypothetical protein